MPVNSISEMIGGIAPRRDNVVATALASLWVVQRQQGETWLWWRPNARGYTPELLHAGLYTEQDAKEHQRLHDPSVPNVYDHKAIPLLRALADLQPGTLGDALGLRTIGPAE